MQVRTTGAAELAQLSGRLRSAEPALRRAFNKTMRTTAKQLVPKIKEAAIEKMPSGGGMNEFINHATIGVRIQSSGKSAGLFIRAERKGHDIYSLDAGSLRHPLFGNRDHWFEQQIPPGFFTETIEEHKDEITQQLLTELRAFARSITAGGSSSGSTADMAARTAAVYKSLGAS